MRRRAREALVVVFVLAGLALGLFGYFWFSGRLELAGRDEYAVFFSDVTGLRVGDPVEVMGIPKGRVAEIALDGTEVRCRVSIDRDVDLTEDTHFAIRSVSYLGSDRYLMVTLGSGLKVAAGHAFGGRNEALDLEETFLRLDRMLDSLDLGAVAGEVRAAIEEIMATVRVQLAGFGVKVDRFAQSFEGTSEGLVHLSRGLDSLSAMLSPGSTVGRLLQSDELYEGVLETNRQVQELILDVRENPRRYFKLSLF